MSPRDVADAILTRWRMTHGPTVESIPRAVLDGMRDMITAALITESTDAFQRGHELGRKTSPLVGACTADPVQIAAAVQDRLDVAVDGFHTRLTNILESVDRIRLSERLERIEDAVGIYTGKVQPPKRAKRTRKPK